MAATGVRFTRLVVAILLAVATLVAIATGGASNAADNSVKGNLLIGPVADNATGLAGAVQGDPFSVVVESRTFSGDPLPVSKDTTVRLTAVSGPGTLSGATTAVIHSGTSSTTVTGALYSTFANG